MKMGSEWIHNNSCLCIRVVQKFFFSNSSVSWYVIKKSDWCAVWNLAIFFEPLYGVCVCDIYTRIHRYVKTRIKDKNRRSRRKGSGELQIIAFTSNDDDIANYSLLADNQFHTFSAIWNFLFLVNGKDRKWNKLSSHANICREWRKESIYSGYRIEIEFKLIVVNAEWGHQMSKANPDWFWWTS